MKIENKQFKDFMLRRVDSSPHSENTILTSTPEGNIKMEAFDPTNVMMSSHIINKSAITNISKMENLSINNMDRLDKIMRTLSSKGQLDIIINEATIQLGTDKESHVLCLVSNEIETDNIVPTLEYSTFFKLKLDYIKDIKKIAGTFKDPIVIIFIYEDKKLHYVIEEDGESTVSKPIQVITNSTEGKQTLKVSLPYFLKIVELLTEEITFYIKTDYPLQIKETSAFISSTYILAPRVEDDDNQPEEEPPSAEQIAEQTGDTNK